VGVRGEARRVRGVADNGALSVDWKTVCLKRE
jgi:hypothetical protein